MGFQNDVTIGRVRVGGLLDWRKGGYTVNLTNNGGISNVINNTGGATQPGIAVNTPRVTDFP